MQSGAALLAEFHLAPDAPLVLGVSGGVDSMVLLTLLAQTGHPLIAAHFDHRLRPQSTAEGQMVATYAARLGATCVRGNWPQAAHPQSGLEAAARTARYAFLADVARRHHAAYIVLAHHADDQLETVLLQLARSGNAQAMSGMRAARPLGDLQVLRPLLNVAKATLYAYAEAHAVPFAEDATNLDVTLRRNRIRHQVVPALKMVNPAVLAHTERFSQTLQGLQTLAQPALDALLASSFAGTSADWTPLAAQPLGVQRLVLEAILQRWEVQAAPATVEAIQTALARGAGNKTFDVPNHRLAVAYRRLVLDPPPAAAVAPRVLTLDDTWHALSGDVQAGLFRQRPQDATVWGYVPAGQALTLRRRQPGDVLVLPDGRQRKLRRFLIDFKVPQSQRDALVVAAQGKRLVWLDLPGVAELFQRRHSDIMQAVLALKNQSEARRI